MAKKAKARVASSREILECLAVKHSEDVFVPECKTGPSQATQHLRMDAWAMARSWANPLATCYEIKVTRADYVKDDKWPGYLPYCNRFYFVCPHKMLSVEEMPAEAGLIWVSSTGTRTFTKKKASHRDVEIPEALWRYLLMARTCVIAQHHEPVDRADYWRRWLAKKDETKLLGSHVAWQIQSLVNAARERADIAESKVKGYTALEEELGKMGVSTRAPLQYFGIHEVLDMVTGALPAGLRMVVRDALHGLTRFDEELDALETQAKELAARAKATEDGSADCADCAEGGTDE